MRPPPLAHSWLLTVATSLLMTSSLVMATITVDNNCLDPTDGCEEPDVIERSSDKKIECKQGRVLVPTILEEEVPRSIGSGVLENDAKLKARCYSRCNERYRNLKCPVGSRNCEKAFPTPDSLSCSANKELVFNGVVVKSPISCDHDLGWTPDSADVVVVDFSTGEDHNIAAFCQDPLPTPQPCDSSCYQNTCGGGCNANTRPIYDINSNKLTCPQGSNLYVFDSKLFEYAQCDANAGWKGYTGAPGETPAPLISFILTPGAKLLAKCAPFSCADQFVGKCPPGLSTCTLKPIFNGDTLSCASGWLVVNSAFYQNAKCSESGWTTNGQTLIKYTTIPFEKLEAHCQSYCSKSMVEDDCPKGECAVAPVYNQNKLTCAANHFLIVGNEVMKEDVFCSATGWTLASTPKKELVNYQSKIEKLKAKCLSRCHPLFVDRTCTAPCSKPIYVSEGEPLFCRSPDEVLVLNGKEVPDVACDKTVGWKEAGKAEPVLVKFSDYTTQPVKSSCKRKPVTTVAPPVTTVTTPVSNVTTTSPVPDLTAAPLEGGSGNDSIYISIIVVLLIIVLALIGVLIYCRKKKRGNSDTEVSKTASKSKSKNSSVKNKGKKGAKNKKIEGKKGKKNQKESSKEKSKKEFDIESAVEMPEHPMSDAQSGGVPLTLALQTPQATPHNPNVMDI